MVESQDRYKVIRKKIVKISNKKFNRPIVCLTAYTAWMAKILDGVVDIVLVGDSLGSTVYGMKNTQEVSIEMMKQHGKAVIDHVNKSITIIDMPYKTYENKSQALKNAGILKNFTKADFIKLEINKNKLPIIKYLTEKKFNVVAHIGVTPQDFKNFNKIKIEGKTSKTQKNLLELAINAQNAGAKILLLECIAQETAKKISSLVKIPTIGIGSSKNCDGQVLVTDDIIKLNERNKKLKFVKIYSNIGKLIKISIKKFANDIKSEKFPTKRNSF